MKLMGTPLAAHTLRGESIGKVNLNLRVENSKYCIIAAKIPAKLNIQKFIFSDENWLTKYLSKRHTNNT